LSSITELDSTSLSCISEFLPTSLAFTGVRLPTRLDISAIAPGVQALTLAADAEFSLSGLSDLRCLGIDFTRVRKIDGLEAVISRLWDIFLDTPDKRALEILEGESRAQLKALRLRAVPRKNCGFLSCAASLKGFWLGDSKMIKSLDGIGHCRELEDLHLSCVRVMDIDQLKDLHRLSRVLLENCGTIRSIVPLTKHTNLRQISLSGSTRVQDGKVEWVASVPGIVHVSVQADKHHDAKKGLKIHRERLAPFMRYWHKG
jgi:hypothetical protein